MHKCKQTKALYRLEKPKGEIRNGQPRETVDSGVHKTQNENKQNKKHNTICAGQRNMQTNTNKARVLLQTTGGKVETFCC